MPNSDFLPIIMVVAVHHGLRHLSLTINAVFLRVWWIAELNDMPATAAG